jgi:hypothetical protein
VQQDNELRLPDTIIVGDAPKHNRVQKWLRDVIGLSQDAESGNHVTQLIGSNLAAITKHIRQLRRDQRHIVETADQDITNLERVNERVRLLERKMQWYEQHVESMRYAKTKLDRIIDKEEGTAGRIVPASEEMEVQDTCFFCRKPLEKGQLVMVGSAMGPDGPQEIAAHTDCYNTYTQPKGVAGNGKLLDASGNEIRNEAADTSRNLSHMADDDCQTGEDA